MSRTRKAIIIALAAAGLAVSGGAIAASGGSAGTPVAGAPQTWYHQ